MRYVQRVNVFLLSIIAIALFCASYALAPQAAAFQPEPSADVVLSSDASLPIGKHSFVFSNWKGPKINVWTYRPDSADEETPIVFVMHGTRRDPERYLNEWIGQADKYGLIIVAPEFSRAKFPGSQFYNLGGVYREGGRGNRGRIKEPKWTFSAIEPIFDEIKLLTGSSVEKYFMYGHSAGGQFVHRFVYFMPDARLELAVPANAGWYTLPSVIAEYPYGLGRSFLDEDALKMAFGKGMIILLGTNDINTESSSLRKTPEANAQGAHRLARGKTFHEAGRLTAEIYKAPFNWRLEYAPGVSHSNGGMAEFAAPLIAEAAKSGD